MSLHFNNCCQLRSTKLEMEMPRAGGTEGLGYWVVGFFPFVVLGGTQG